VRAVREVLEAAARAGAGAGPAAGGAAGAGAGPAAGGAAGGVQAAAAGMAAQGPLDTFAEMLASYRANRTLTDEEKRAYLQARANFKHPQTETFKEGPGDLKVMAQALQAALKVATAITTSHALGPNEDIGVALFCSAFNGDALNLARTALSDTPQSDGATFRLHVALIALLRAYLPPRVAKLCRDAGNDLVFPPSFSQGWTSIVRLYDLQCHCPAYCCGGTPCQEARSAHVGQVPPDPGGRGAAFDSLALDHLGAVLHGGPQRHYEGSYEPAVNGQ